MLPGLHSEAEFDQNQHPLEHLCILPCGHILSGGSLASCVARAGDARSTQATQTTTSPQEPSAVPSADSNVSSPPADTPSSPTSSSTCNISLARRRLKLSVPRKESKPPQRHHQNAADHVRVSDQRLCPPLFASGITPRDYL